MSFPGSLLSVCVSLINSPAQCLLMGSVFSGNPVNEIRFHFFFFYYLTFRGRDTSDTPSQVVDEELG